MAYGLKYKFIFDSLNGVETKIEVLKDGYSGSVTQRPLGQSPVLRQQRNDCVAGSSLAFTPECQVDGEFSEFYTTNAKEFLVNLYRGGVKIWSGFITPELYSEPDIAPPYDVNITATDGLGELRRYYYQPLGKVTLASLFSNLLSFTGQSLSVNFISRLAYSGVAYNAFFANTHIDIDYKAGETCYDVLQHLLATFNATICYYAGAWLIVRENDITITSGKPDYINSSGQAASFNGGLMDITSMGAGGLWPVDFTSTSIDPAQNSIEVTAPWHLISGLLNSAMTQDASWTKSTNATYNSTMKGYSLLPQAYISQNKSQKIGKPLLLSIDAAAYIYRPNNVKKYSEAILEVTFTPTGGSVSYLAEDEQGGIVWSSSASTITYRIESGSSRDTAVRNECNIPVVLDSNGNPVTGTLAIKISASESQGLKLFGAYLTVAAEDGYKDILKLNNGARGEAPGIEVTIGYETSDLADYKDYYGGILLTSGNALITSLSTQNFSNLDFLSLISRDYARSIALPRLRTTGTLDTPSGFSLRPLLLFHRGTYRWLETFEWDLLNDNMDFAAVSIPVATINVSNESITATGSASGSAENTIGRLSPGSGEEGLTIMLSNYAHVFEAGSNGYAYESTDTIRVIAFKGTTAVPTTIGTISGTETGLTATKQNDGTTNASIAIAVSTSLNKSGSLSIPITVDGVTINLQYSWALAVKGANGSPGSSGYTTTRVTLYQRAASQPSKPLFNVTYYFSNGTVSGNDLGNWTVNPPAVNANHDPLWIITGLAYSRDATATISSWDGPVKYLEDLAGVNGKTLRGPTLYDSTFPYEGKEGNGTFIDVVVNVVNGQPDYSHLYMAKKDTTGHAPTNTTYWEETTWQDFVATKLFFAAYAYVQNLGANAVKIQGAGSTVYGGFMPPYTDDNGNYVFWVGNSNPAYAKAWIDGSGNSYFEGTIKAGILYKSFSYSTLTSPNTLVISSSSPDIIALKLQKGTGAATGVCRLVLPAASSMEGRLIDIYSQSTDTAKLKIESGYGATVKTLLNSNISDMDITGHATLISDGTYWWLLHITERGR